MRLGGVDVDEGFRLGPYTLVAQLGRGAFAPVWLARELWGEVELRTVAVKLFVPGRGVGTGIDDARLRALDEARALCKVEHPNIVRFYSVAANADGSLLGLVMEHVQGRTVDRRISEDGPLPVADAVEVGKAIASALAAVHAVGLVHRDVKPGNVVEAMGVHKLIDFGIATGDARRARAPAPPRPPLVDDDVPLEADEDAHAVAVVPSAGSRPSGSFATSGTMGYVDPAATTAAPTPASDIYSLGATMFVMLTAQLPAAAAARLAGAAGLDRDVLEGRTRAPSLAAFVPDAPPSLVKLVDAMLEPEPARRPRAAEAVAWDLEHVKREIAGRARPLPPEEIGPFRGLGRFEQEDRDVYFGRSVEIATALEMVRTRGLVALVGASGSGKSSLARAGLLPAILDGDLGGWPKAWDAVVVMPGPDPWTRLEEGLGVEAKDADALADALGERVQASGRGILLLVDQLEELVTVAEAGSARKAAAFLARVGLDARPGVRCIVAARRDLLGPLLELGALGRAMTKGTMLVAPMTKATWGEVIEHALGAYGYRLESEKLQDELLMQLADTVDAMPLVEFALTELWSRRDRENRVLTRSALVEIGGVGGALELHAERVRHALVQEDEGLATVLYTVVMATTTAQGRALTPERVLRAIDPAASKIVDRLEKERIFVREGDAITLAHEALLVQWTRLRRWVAEARADRLLAEELERDAEGWDGDHDAERMWRKRRLIAGEDLVKSNVRVSEKARAFLVAARRRERRDKLVMGTIGAILSVGLLGGAVTYFRDLGTATMRAEQLAAESQKATLESKKAMAAAQEAEQRASRLAARAERRAALYRAFTPGDRGPSPAPACPEGMKAIPPGKLAMGSTEGPAEEKPVHDVELKAFCMDVTEVTADAYAACVAADACAPADVGKYCNASKPDRGNHPANCVSWTDASRYCAWAKKSLPTEEEWEYAARGTDGRKYPWGNAEPGAQLCWNRHGAGDSGTCVVGAFPSGRSPFGIEDMGGNVWEWTASGWSADYGKARGDLHRVNRGGGWSIRQPAYVRATVRSRDAASARSYDLGFRCVI